MKAKIPKTTAPYFQEYDFSTLDIGKDAELIMGRTLEFGTREELKWLFKTYGSQKIKEFVSDAKWLSWIYIDLKADNLDNVL